MDIMLILQFLHKIQIYLLLLLGFYSLIKYFKPKLLIYFKKINASPLAVGERLPSSTGSRGRLKSYTAWLSPGAANFINTSPRAVIRKGCIQILNYIDTASS
jgi:hypothetical protein